MNDDADVAELQALIAALEHGDDGVRWEAARTLANRRDSRGQEALFHALEHPSARVRWTAVQALHSWGKYWDDGWVIPALVNALGDQDGEVRAIAARAIGDCKPL